MHESVTSARARRIRIGRRLSFVVFVLLVVVAGGIPLYVAPAQDHLLPADAIVVLGGPGEERYAYGIELANRGLAAHVALSDPSGGEDDRLTGLCAEPSIPTVTCFAPRPPTTSGEARAIRDLAAREHWRKIIVITFLPHLSRAGFIIRRCFAGDVLMIASPDGLSPGEWAWQYLYQTAGYARALINPPC
ncbi:YdcF family protein [Rhodococcus ruber]|uniref:DUF218 domain-containing protein n=1 Tax=Rhodococcus ruber TaxID=1830 RepID=A0A098BSZ8_9NOCA|nr:MULTISPECIES: YdcF family protein [Rhodococcus]RIK11995.1 MAG: YdcF family protein [Acidobacteriota bacterium]AXY51057.1 hypothetical protein YT1_1622 [Rhodococcus ruber]MCD2126849.1 YdcF family protein [Rhodococcus ruber]MCZ1070757.1 YdcF family protein [Rhodococcus sp. A5(2022)]MCZ4503728.1 YdcF family protein [Rhodococcus ruber]